MTRKPYLNEVADQLDMESTESPEAVQARIRQLLQSYDPDMVTVIPALNGGRVQLTINDNKSDRFQAAIRQARYR